MTVELKGGAAVFEARNPEELHKCIGQALALQEWKMPLKVRIASKGGARLDYLAVFWIWMRSFTMQLKAIKPKEYAVLDDKGKALHDLFCTRHLGMLEAKQVGKTIVPARLKTLTDIDDRGEWYDFLRKVEEDAISGGLRIPENESQYEEDKRREVA